MTSRERARAAASHKKPDRTPAAFEAVGSVTERLLREYGLSEADQLYDKFAIDIAAIHCRYSGPPLSTRRNEKGDLVKETYWGWEETIHTTEIDSYFMTTRFPLEGCKTIADVDAHRWPNPDWFDYESIKRQCEKYKDKAIVFGHEGPFQIVTFLISMEEFFVLMLEEPDVAKRILSKMAEFELEYYERALTAADGQIDFIRPHDDYGTQISLLFSVDMWREFFRENTIKLVNLAHKHGAFYQQHSCGAVAPLIPELIACGVDVLEPLQKVPGLYPEELAQYSRKIAFHGGIDTQGLLPNGSPDEVRGEVRTYIETLGREGGYILMSSQGLEPDVPTANIEALFSTDRSV
ncbi:MAG: uroporphyrinogen decarboxylase family protein [Oscillospiraceae bacterium]